MRMGPWNQPNGRSTQRTQCKSLHYDNKRRWSIKSIAGWTIKSRINQGVKVKIYSTLLLYQRRMDPYVLSRKDYINTMEDNKDVQMLKDEMWTRRQITAEIKMIWRNQVVEETTILEEIWWNGTREQEVCKKLEKKDEQVWEENRLIYVDGRIYVPNSQKIKERILQDNHELVDIGHLGQQQIMDLIKRNYWWPGIKKDVKKYV